MLVIRIEIRRIDFIGEGILGYGAFEVKQIASYQRNYPLDECVLFWAMK